jgi:hypothetical protein
MNLTKGVITKDEARQLVPVYVDFVEVGPLVNGEIFNNVLSAMETLKRGQDVITCHEGTWVRCKVSKVERNSFRAIDGPVIRVGNGECTWRVDGCDYCYPVAK